MNEEMSGKAVLNMTRRILPITLDSHDAKGNRNSLILTRREKSRELTEQELKSKQIVELLARRKPKCQIKIVEA